MLFYAIVKERTPSMLSSMPPSVGLLSSLVAVYSKRKETASPSMRFARLCSDYAARSDHHDAPEKSQTVLSKTVDPESSPKDENANAKLLYNKEDTGPIPYSGSRLRGPKPE